MLLSQCSSVAFKTATPKTQSYIELRTIRQFKISRAVHFLGQVKYVGSSGMLLILDGHLPSFCMYRVYLLGSEVNVTLNNILNPVN
jgi:hypothetical protein